MPALLLERDEKHTGYIDLDQNELRNAIIQALGADPGTPQNGQIWQRTDGTPALRVRLGGATKILATMDDVTAGGISSTLFDAKGDSLWGTADNTVARQAVGANGTVVVANSAQATGVEWRGLGSADLSDFTTAARAAISVTDTAEIDLTYAGGAISAALIAGSVGYSKLVDQAQATFLMRAAGAGTGSPIAGTAAQAKTALAIVPGDITGFDTQVRTSRLDQMAAPTADVALNGRKITGLADGTAAQDAATFGQLTAAINGFDWKEPVRIVLTANDSLNGLAARDGVTPVAGDRVLATNQTTASQNGIYVAAAGAWARAADFDTDAETVNATVFVEAGTVGAGDIYTNSGTTLAAQSWVKASEGNAVYAGSGTITLTGNAFSVTANSISETHLTTSVAGAGLTGGNGTPLAVAPGTSLEISGDTIRLAASAAGNGLTGGGAAALAVGVVAPILVGADSISLDTTVVGRRVQGTLTGGANSEAKAHGLGNQWVDAFLFNPTTEERVDVYYECTDANTVTFYAASGNTLTAGWVWVVIG